MDGGVEESNQKAKRAKQYKKFLLNNGYRVIYCYLNVGAEEPFKNNKLASELIKLVNNHQQGAAASVISFAKDTRERRRRTELCVTPRAMRSMILFSNNVHWDCTDLVSARTCKEEAPISQDQKLHTRGPGNSSYFKRAPILSCASHPPFLAVAPAASPAPQSTSSCTIHRGAPFTCSQCSLLALTSGQGCRAT